MGKKFQEMETISENVADLLRQIKEKDACLSTLEVKVDNFDKLIKAVEEIRRMYKQQRQMNEYYEEWRKSR